ncbi:MAG: DUF302 domain-containing protein [Nitrospinota bacterium]|nr:DUF302 domain-containing protein [Nitrospinota bacterium]
MNTGYGFSKTVKMTFADAEAKVRNTLKERGFGILTEVDVKKTLKEKINAEFMPYKILGACNPPFAHKSLNAEREIGLMMPCNVIVYEDEKGVHVSAVDPKAAMGMIKNPELEKVAGEVSAKLKEAIEAV